MINDYSNLKRSRIRRDCRIIWCAPRSAEYPLSTGDARARTSGLGPRHATDL